MKKVIVTIVLFLIVFMQAMGQNNNFTKKNTIVFEMLGHGGFYSLNYERFLINRKIFKSSISFGTAFYPFIVENTPYTFNVSFNQLISFSNFHIVLGFGQLYTSKVVVKSNFDLVEYDDSYYTTFKIGIRYRRYDSKISYRLGFTPAWWVKQNIFIPWGMLGIGYNF